MSIYTYRCTFQRQTEESDFSGRVDNSEIHDDRIRPVSSRHNSGNYPCIPFKSSNSGTADSSRIKNVRADWVPTMGIRFKIGKRHESDHIRFKQFNPIELFHCMKQNHSKTTRVR